MRIQFAPLLECGSLVTSYLRASALVGNSNRGNCVMRTRIRKPGSTFFPCICLCRVQCATLDQSLAKEKNECLPDGIKTINWL